MSTTDPIINQDLRQTMLSFAYLAYTGEGITTPNPEATMLGNINAALPQISFTNSTGQIVNLSSWSLAWGPVAYTIPGALYQDNMVFVARNGQTSQYVIAIRGTNFISEVDWFLEDFEVINTMPWPIPGATSSCQTGAAISESTSIDLNVLLGKPMSDSNGLQLLQFLQSITKSQGAISICVTGHSLGGTLSNTFGLYLLENKSLWDNSTGVSSTVCCISFASPTAGNDLYAQNANIVYSNAFNANNAPFPGWDVSLDSNLDNVCCNLDVAPLAYTSNNICNNGLAGPVFSLYSSPNNPTDNVDFDNLPDIADDIWSFFQSDILQPLATSTKNNLYTQLNQNMIPGTFNGSGLTLTTSVFDALSAVPAYLDAFSKQAAWQHSCSYPVYLSVPALFNPNIIVRNEPIAAIPVITSISPTVSDRFDTRTITITGSGFIADSLYGNFILFSDQNNIVPYVIKSVTATEIVATFYLSGCNTGQQSITVSTTNPYLTSNAVTFSIQ